MGEAGFQGLEVRLRQEQPIRLDVDLRVAPGELLALVGPSGSGKSTTLRAIAGLHRVAEGLVRCDGELWRDSARGLDLPARKRRSGFVFQSYALFPHLTALENVTAAMPETPRGARRTKGERLLARVHLSGLESRRPGELSGGQQQRVAVARALAREPKALLLDEPFSAVDRSTRDRLQRELAELRRGLNIPIVLVTHDLDEARRLADRIAVIHRGRTLQTGPPEEVLTRPASPAVARLVDLRNLFRGRVIRHDDALGCTLFEWRGHTLEASPRPDLEPGGRIAWCIPAESIVLHRRDRPSRGERENPVAGLVADALPLGEMTSLRVQVGESGQTPLLLSVPTHVARRNRLEAGAAIKVSLLAAAIHLMRAEDDIPV